MSFLRRLFGVAAEAPSTAPTSVGWDARRAAHEEEMRLLAGVGVVDGRPTFEHMDAVAALKRAGRLEEALRLIMRLISANEAHAEEASRRYPDRKYTLPPAYYEEAAIVLRKLKRYDEEVAVLARYERAQPNVEARDSFRGRIEKARALAAKAR